MRFSIHAIAAIILAGTTVLADDPTQSSKTARIDRLFSQWNRKDAPGCAVAVVKNGRVVYRKAFGSAHLDYEVPNTTDTIFEAGSLTKSITCACIALLFDRGVLSPDDDVRKYVPELHEFDTPIRIRHLVRCRSGLWAQWHIVQLAGWASEPVQSPYGDDDLLALLSGQKKLPFIPGTQFRYGTSDYFLLGVIVKRATGRSLAEFAHKHLFDPLGMKRTYYLEDPTLVVKHRAVGYYRDFPNGKRWRSWTSNAAGPGGWALKTTVEDLVRWNANFDDNKLGKGRYFKTFLAEGTLLENRNCLDGQPTGSYRGLKRIQFTGGMPGYLAAVARFPEQKFAVVCLSNNSTQINPWKIATRIADVYLAGRFDPDSKPADTTRKPEPIVKIAAKHLQNKTGTFRSKHLHTWRIAYKDGKLWNTNHLNQTYELLPLSETRFRPAPYPQDTFVFARKADAAPFELRLDYDGGSLSFERVKLVDPATLKLKEYSGEFYSDELAIAYRFRVIDDALWLRVGNRRWERLDPTLRDQFVPHVRTQYDNRILTFVRNKHGRVVAVDAALWRVKAVRFHRR